MATHRQLLVALGAWSAGSILGGAVLWRAGNGSGARAFGRQTLVWGAVDAAIVAYGAASPPPAPARLRTVLLANSLADVGYLALGIYALRRERWRADGAAILVQGAFLLALDSHFAYHLEVPAAG